MPVKGGESPMIQQQNYSLAAVAKRDAQDDPFGTAKPAPAPANENEPPPEDDQAEDDTEMTDDNVAQFIFEVRSGLYSTGSSP
jgi:hypothetical protein